MTYRLCLYCHRKRPNTTSSLYIHTHMCICKGGCCDHTVRYWVYMTACHGVYATILSTQRAPCHTLTAYRANQNNEMCCCINLHVNITRGEALGWPSYLPQNSLSLAAITERVSHRKQGSVQPWPIHSPLAGKKNTNMRWKPQILQFGLW